MGVSYLISLDALELWLGITRTVDVCSSLLEFWHCGRAKRVSIMKQ
jgi:hypothetical protein